MHTFSLATSLPKWDVLKSHSITLFHLFLTAVNPRLWPVEYKHLVFICIKLPSFLPFAHLLGPSTGQVYWSSFDDWTCVDKCQYTCCRERLKIIHILCYIRNVLCKTVMKLKLYFKRTNKSAKEWRETLCSNLKQATQNAGAQLKHHCDF